MVYAVALLPERLAEQDHSVGVAHCGSLGHPGVIGGEICSLDAAFSLGVPFTMVAAAPHPRAGVRAPALEWRGLRIL
jgi:hypothetical protein